MSKDSPIAIVGMAALLPGAPDLKAYWRNIVDARDCLTEIPQDHSWSPRDYHDPDPATPDKTWATKGGFLDKVPFDPLEHGVIPVALEAIDTDQLLALIVARECLRDAGLDPDGGGWNRDRTSVILGHTSTNELVVDLSARLHGPRWRKAMERQGVPSQVIDQVVADIVRFYPTWQEQSFPGMLANVAAGRIANRLDLGGTNATVDAACASSLGAMHYAISELQAGRSDLALSGGTDTFNDIFMYMCFSKTPALSRAGDARPFDAGSDGIVISEGVALFALKRLADAERDGDRIYAVIRGIGTSSDGRNKSIYAPASSGQVKAVRRAYDDAGFALESVELIEAHGTGTKAGDLAEFNGLREVFAASTRPERHVALGSVKSQIGHTKATAGAAGLMKVALALYQRVLPPTAKVEAPNPKMQFAGSPLYLNSLARPWVRSAATPRRAGVSAFGFGGTNYHFALEEHENTPTRVVLPARSELFLLGGTDPVNLLEQIQALAATPSPTLAHAARETHRTWRGGAWVLGFVASDLSDLPRLWSAARALAHAGVPAEQEGVRLAHPEPGEDRIAVLFPGQGSQAIGMGRTATLRHPPMLQALDEADAALRRAGRPGLGAKIHPVPWFSEEERRERQAELTATEWAQPALGAVEVGLWRTLSTFGVQASAFAGHSYGELVALHAAGSLDASALWALSNVRGTAMAARADQDRGTMAAVRGDLAQVEAVLSALPGVILANYNHPTQGVIAGTRDQVGAAVRALAAAGFPAKELPVSAAFHSPLVLDARAPLAAALADTAVCAPTVAVMSCATGAPYPADPAAIRELLAEQVTCPVRWIDVVSGLVQLGCTTWLEVGPGKVLSGLVRHHPAAAGAAVIPVDPDLAADGDEALKRALLALACRGVVLRLDPFLAEILPEPPRRATSKAAVWIGGPHYKRPDTLNPPAPDLPAWLPTPKPIEKAARVYADGSVERARRSRPDVTDDVAGPPLMMAPPSRPAPPRPAPASAASPAETRVSPSSSGVSLTALLEATRDSLRAFQETQARAAEVHRAFLDGHAKANESFAELFRTHARLVEQAGGGTQAAAAPVPAPLAAPPAPPVAATHAALEAAIVRPTTSGATTLHMPRNDGPTIAASDDLPPLVSALAYTELVKTGAPLPEPERRPSAGTPDVRQALFQAIASKTGYPADVLTPAMDLESDLGVDSIKRVEILAAVQDAIPGLPEIPSDELGSLRTVADVARRLEAALPGLRLASAVPPSPDVQGAVFSVVAQKTGYPQELLGASMNLEQDLGIDSIKRVEIFSALQEILPGSPSVPDEELGSLRTLGDIILRLGTVNAVVQPTLAAAPRSGEGVMSALRRVIAQRTGYPEDVLSSDMNLEQDLGIDSIKRVEILSALQEALPDLPDLPEDLVASARTLAELAAIAEVRRTPSAGAVTAVPVTATPAPPMTAAPAPSSTTGPVRREVVIVPAPEGAGSTLSGPLGIARDLLGLADELAAALRKHGVDARVLDLDWSSRETLKEGLPSGLGGIVHLGTLGAYEGTLQDRVRGGFFLAQAAPDLGLFAVVTGLGGTFGVDGIVGPPLAGALSGLAKTVALEHPRTRALAIDVDPESLDVEALAAELLTDRGVVEVGLADEVITLQAAPVALNTSLPGKEPLEPGDLVVVSGGARGVTAAVVIEMARRWKPSFLLLGRTPVPGEDPAWAHNVPDEGLKTARIARLRAEAAAFDPRRLEREVAEVVRAREVRATLDAVDEAGSRVFYTVADVNDPEAVRGAITRTTAVAGPVRGVVHGAGMIADKLIVEKTAASYDEVSATKVGGLDALLRAIDLAELRLLAVFSSVAGRYGNRGQVDYAMANEAITKVAQVVAASGVPAVKAFHWGPWAGGMVSPGLAAAFASRGLALVGLEEGAKAFCDEFERGGPCVEVVLGGPDRPGALLGATEDHEEPRLQGSVPLTLRADQVFLDDHRIDGKPVLPFVMALEFMASEALKAAPGLRLHQVRDVAVLKGVVLDTPEVALTLRWSEAAPAPGAEVALHFEIAGPPTRAGLPVVHYRGTVDLGREAAEGDRFGGSNGLGGQPYPYPVEEAYDRFLFHGPGFQGIERITGMSDHGIVGQLSSSRPKRLGMDAASWATDPVTLDSALQLVGLWVREHKGAAALPSYVERYTQLTPFRGPVDVHIEMEPTRTAKGRYSAAFVDGAGRVVARIEGGQYTALAGLEERYHAEKA
jgi:acyl transferase domain-containing protein